MKTTIRPAGGRDITLYRNLFNMYQNELSVYYTNGEFSYVDENGYFNAASVNEIFPPDDAILPYVITGDEKNIGLLLVTKKPYARFDYQIEELFLVRAARGTGSAQEALLAFFGAHPGTYTLEVFRNNERAYRFWKKLIAGSGRLLDEKPSPNNMTELTFFIPPFPTD